MLYGKPQLEILEILVKDVVCASDNGAHNPENPSDSSDASGDW